MKLVDIVPLNEEQLNEGPVLELILPGKTRARMERVIQKVRKKYFNTTDGFEEAAKVYASLRKKGETKELAILRAARAAGFDTKEHIRLLRLAIDDLIRTANAELEANA